MIAASSEMSSATVWLPAGAARAASADSAPTAAAASRTLPARAMKRSFFATKSVSVLSSRIVTLPSRSTAVTRPSLVERSARFALPFAPELTRILTAEVSLSRAFYLVRHDGDRRSERMARLAREVAKAVREEVQRLESLARLTDADAGPTLKP